MSIRILALVAPVAVAACAPRVPPPALPETRAEIRLLEGRWEGEYASREWRQYGRLVFNFDVRDDTAHGRAWIRPAGAPAAAMAGTPADPVPAVALRFTVLGGEIVGGMTEPYRSAECACVVTTTFRGHLDHDRIRGTYTTCDERHRSPLSGRWEAARVRPKAGTTD